jgi:hypothetical protein
VKRGGEKGEIADVGVGLERHSVMGLIRVLGGNGWKDVRASLGKAVSYDWIAVVCGWIRCIQVHSIVSLIDAIIESYPLHMYHGIPGP